LRDDIGRPQAIIHRDLNPANVMVSYTGAVKLIDFGIAKAARKVYETRTGVIKGTYGYMAPEQLSKRQDMDHRADIFALGVMMYEVCLGIHPFDASTEANIIDRLLKAAYQKPRELDPGFPKDLDRLIGRCMAVDPTARPENMHEVVEEIATHLEHHQQVPTMRRVSDLAHSLIPDTESPAPLEPMTRDPQREPKRDVAAQIYDREREQVDTLPGRDRGTQPTARRDRDESTHEQRVPGGLQPMASSEESDTVIANRPPAGALDVPLVGAAGMGLSEQLTQAQPLPPERIAEAQAETQVNRAVAAPASGRLRQLALFIGSTTLVFGVGIAAFIAARTFSGTAPPPAVVTLPADAAPATPEPEPEPEHRWLNVTSEHSGASIFVDGTEAPLETPATLELPMDTERVVVRAELEGYVTQERPIHATAGEARFVLTALTIADAGPDGSADAAPAEAPVKARPRMRRRRPRMRRR
ncbi:MAG: serine/threonine protein kinase, partial [Deltaproteobacteria bacterium]|nr:serine/threonine protein kinase [Deltaproteobacteria bacterium]